MNLFRIVFIAVLICAGSCRAADDKKTPAIQNVTHRINGLCYPERADELRELFKDHPKVKLISVDYARAEATFEYNPKEISRESLGNMMGAKAFSIKPPLTTPEDQLTSVDIPIVGLDCKGCCLGAYNSIYKIDGVERATVSFKEGHVIALIDPAKTNRAAIEEALKKAQVGLKKPPEPAPEKPADKAPNKPTEKATDKTPAVK